VAELIVILGEFTGVYCLIHASVFSSRPSSGAKEFWEERYAAHLPPGSADLRPHWVQRDIGVHIFSVVLPQGMTEAQAFDSLETKVTGFRPFARRKSELVLRRPNRRLDPTGFFEIRYRFAPESGRLSIMAADLDSGTERRSHPKLIQELHAIAASCAKSGRIDRPFPLSLA
jgi:hypothetical protein